MPKEPSPVRTRSIRLLSLVTLAVLTACGPAGPDRAPEEVCASTERLGEDGPFLDPETQNRECAHLNRSYSLMKNVSVQAKTGSYYEKLFRSTDAQGPVRFFNERVHMIFPSNTRMQKSLGEYSAPEEEFRLGTVAVNVGFMYWRQASNNPGLNVAAGRVALDTSSPYVGYIQLGQIFSRTKPWFQASTLVHESRHSDCDSTKSDICGHPHDKCPEGHEYAGEVMCDTRGIGPYFTEAVYVHAVAESCVSCTEVEKQSLLMISADSLSRVANLDDIKSGKETRFALKRIRGMEPAKLRERARAFQAKRKGGN